MATCKFGKNNEKIKAIFFDMDNTLIQTRKADIATIQKVNSFFNTSLSLTVKILSWDDNIIPVEKNTNMFLL